MRAWSWYVFFPGDCCTLGLVHFRRDLRDKPPNEQVVRQWARDFEEVERLPAGFQCWPAGRT